jgi:hypothetical protein
MATLFIGAGVPVVDRDIALSLKFEFVSCSWTLLDVIDIVAVD